MIRNANMKQPPPPPPPPHHINPNQNKLKATPPGISVIWRLSEFSTNTKPFVNVVFVTVRSQWLWSVPLILGYAKLTVLQSVLFCLFVFLVSAVCNVCLLCRSLWNCMHLLPLLLCVCSCGVVYPLSPKILGLGCPKMCMSNFYFCLS